MCESIYACLALCFIDIIAHYMTKTYVKRASSARGANRVQGKLKFN